MRGVCVALLALLCVLSRAAQVIKGDLDSDVPPQEVLRAVHGLDTDDTRSFVHSFPGGERVTPVYPCLMKIYTSPSSSVWHAPAAAALSHVGCEVRPPLPSSKIRVIEQPSTVEEQQLSALARLKKRSVLNAKKYKEAEEAGAHTREIVLASGGLIPAGVKDGEILDKFPLAWPILFLKPGLADAAQRATHQCDILKAKSVISGIDDESEECVLSPHDFIPRMYQLTELGIEAFEIDFQRTAEHAEWCRANGDAYNNMPFHTESANLHGCPYRREHLFEYSEYTRVQPPQPRIDRGHNLWILKPVNDAQGRDLTVIDSLDHPAYLYAKANPGSYVAQKYVEHPLLVNERYKFDFRLNVVLASVDPLVVLVNDIHWVRVAKGAYDPENSGDLFAHICNRSFQTFLEDGEVHIEKLDSFVERIGDGLGHSPEILETIVRERLEQLIRRLSLMFPAEMHREGSFEHFGFDVVLDETWRPWLLEINAENRLHFEWKEMVEQWATLIWAVFDQKWNVMLPSDLHVQAVDDTRVDVEGIELERYGDWKMIYRGESRRPVEEVEAHEEVLEELMQSRWSRNAMLSEHFRIRGLRSVPPRIEEEERVRLALEHHFGTVE